MQALQARVRGVLSGAPPIRCECGWWYENDHGTIKERYWQRIEPYREPPATLFLGE